ncbi:Tex family protein [Anaerosalibacter bizertensis]|uniref:RNA-binding transcriptional accessory protein n=1 Tax=Anaerosalibacter bizertensis TaxID=932217 RepID=A0A9Q4AC39_9FIRM|nr:Tex family protein [Anaerosalibacter bizertensis]MCB5558387.1 RNA-binding transcriptional accessory protein [Anaerosalibacter bizertensis]MCG4564674.1 RNA-binding transcriptional accessory protein [Anaerosalibacter bizertensis]
MDISSILMKEFKLKSFQVNNTIRLIDEGNTIPFIARYRKEQTGELNDIVLRELNDRLNYLRNLENRQDEVIRLIEEQGKLTDDLKKEILNADTLQRVEDLYRPYKKKRRTRATKAKEKGLEPLANIIIDEEIEEGSLEKIASPFIDIEKGVESTEEAYNGAMDIIAEIVSDNAKFRKIIRKIFFEKGILKSEVVDSKESTVYEMYYSYNEKVKTIPNHRILAINRGEKEKVLRVKILVSDEEILNILKGEMIKNNRAITTEYLEMAIEDGYKRLIFPSIEREVRGALTERAEEEGIKVFSTNLKPLLMQPPIKNKVVMGVDPGFRTGCKVAVVDGTGKLLETTVVYPTEPQNQVEKTKTELKRLINKHNVDIIAIGNGTASRETEQVVVEMLKELENKDVSYIIVSEAGASVYSASKIANEEFPGMDVSLRGAISIARRLQDPLAELVKIEPKHIGIGQYQHDLNQTKLNEALSGVVESSVNTVGVDLNTASTSLLKYVSGISNRVAENIVDYRDENGIFKNRKELLKVKGLGEKTFIQCAGFLRIPEGENPLDNTAVHPESYDIAEKILEWDALDSVNLDSLAEELDVGIPTLKDIIEEIKKPGRDPRENMPKPIFRTDVLNIEDLKPDMVLTGTVRNVVDFGAFVDIGVKQDGLVHISKLSDKFVKHPMEVVKIGDIVQVRVLDIDISKGKISLSMKDV